MNIYRDAEISNSIYFNSKAHISTLNFFSSKIPIFSLFRLKYLKKKKAYSYLREQRLLLQRRVNTDSIQQATTTCKKL